MAFVQDPNSKSFNFDQMILFWREHPVQAAQDIFGIDLDTHQRIVLKNRWTHSTIVDILSRGTGKTFLSALTPALRAILYPGNRLGLIGSCFRQAKYMFTEVEKLYEMSPLFQECCVRPPARTADSCYVKLKSAQGMTGSYIEALPLGADGGKIRGARFYEVYADEAAQIDEVVLNTVVRGFMATSQNPMEQVKRMREMMARVKRGEITEDQAWADVSVNKYCLSSTAFFQYNHLWGRVARMIEQIHGEFKRRQRANQDVSMYKLQGQPLNGGQIPFRVLSDGKRCLHAFTCYDPSPGFLNWESIKQAQLEMSDYMFRMEYNCYFPADSEGFYRRSLLDTARTHAEFGPVLAPRKGCIYILGIDPARTHDNFAISIFEIDPAEHEIRLVRVMSWNKKDFPFMAREIRRLVKYYGVRCMAMDAGGGGTTVRDLLADPNSIPAGERAILEQDFDEHRMRTGDRILAPLVQFSSFEWVHDANHNLLAGLQSGLLKIAAVPPVAAHQQIWTPELDEADEEMERALLEWSSIIVIPAGSRMRWDTPTKTQRKDRYSAILIGYDAALKLLESYSRPQALASGFWL